MDQIASQMNIKNIDDWYRVKPIDIASRGGTSFLQYFGNSLGAALSSLFPHHQWKLWKFGQVPKGFWEMKQNVFEYLDWMAEQYGLQNVLGDWSKLPKKLRGNLRQISKSNNILANIASEDLDPNIFDEWAQDKTKGLLQGFLQNLFPGKTVLLDHQISQLTAIDPQTKFDLFVSDVNIAIEYQGKMDQDVLNKYQKKLDDKKNVAKENGITVIEIPYWWDCTIDSLKATIHSIRPDLIRGITGMPIPTTPPSEI